MRSSCVAANQRPVSYPSFLLPVVTVMSHWAQPDYFVPARRGGKYLTGIFLEKFFEIQCTVTVAATPVLSYFLFVTPITFPPLGLVAVAYVVET